MGDELDGVSRDVLRRIDRVFDAVVGSGASSRPNDELIAPATVRRRRGDAALAVAGSSTGGGGGFLPPSPPMGGGFLVEDEDEAGEDMQAQTATHLPLEKVPEALQMLDLPPADEDVLSIFQNAAGGWDGSRDGEGVSRKDWRSVCAILLMQQDGDDLDEETPEASEPVDSDGSPVESPAGRNEDEKNWVNDDEEDSEDDDEYTQTSARRATRKSKGKVVDPGPQRGKRRRRKELSDEDEELETPKAPTRRQKATCRAGFALFFPDVPDDQLESQRILIKDVVRVAALVKQRMTAEEVVEMLEEFSTSADKSVSLQDFERMMMAAKLA